MAQTIHDHIQIPQRRVRELARAHDRAWSRRARSLRESSQILIPSCRELNQRTDAPLLALLEEGVPEGQWVAVSRGRCVLVEREGGELVLRSVRRNAVEDAPQDDAAKTVVQQSVLSNASRYREAVVFTRRVSGWICVLALGLFGIGNVAGFTLDSQAVLRVAIWCLIAAMIAFIVYMLARMTTPGRLEDMPGDESEQSGGVPVEEVPGSESAYADGPDSGLQRGVRLQRRDVSHLQARERPGPYVATISPDTEASAGGRPDAAEDKLRDSINELPSADLAEGFAHARALPDNDAQGSDSVRVVEARGELASILGIERGEAVLEIIWATSGSGRSGHSYLPYREAITGTSLDSQLPPSEKVRPVCRHALHERLIEEKSLGALEPNVTYRIGPDSYQLFGRPVWSSGAGGEYILEDKLKYLMERSAELGLESYEPEDLMRMKEIITGNGYAPTHEELLRFALQGGIQPGFLFEDSGMDLRSCTRRSADPSQPVLWRVEAAISEAHGLPVEIFERKLMRWQLSCHAWMFR